MRRITLYPPKRQQILLFLMMTVLLSSLDSPPTADAGNPTPAAYSPAPNFSRVDLDQRNVDLTAYRGKVVVLNFWATWCAPCLTEMPLFVEWQQEYGGRGCRSSASLWMMRYHRKRLASFTRNEYEPSPTRTVPRIPGSR
jgi:thiol-disulfide isomerase/thioredoxin